MLKRVHLFSLAALAATFIVVLLVVAGSIPASEPQANPTLMVLPSETAAPLLEDAPVLTDAPEQRQQVESTLSVPNDAELAVVSAAAADQSSPLAALPTQSMLSAPSDTIPALVGIIPTALPFPTLPLVPAPTASFVELPPPQAPIPNQMIITFNPGTGAQDRAAYIESLGGVVTQTIDALETVVIEVSSQQSTLSLPKSDAVVAAEPDFYVSALVAVPPSDPLYGDQWALPAIGAPNVWLTLPAETPHVTVAVIDSGVCADHPDLQGRLLPGWDYIENDSQPQDAFGHGCGVTGIIAANADDGIGMAGVAPNALVMPLRVLDAQGLGTYSNVAAAVVYAVDHGAQVINLSLGGIVSSGTLENAINYAAAHNVLVVAAAGNSGSSQVLYPAAYAPVVSVGSVDQNLQVSSFSNGGTNVDLLAPGRDILSSKRDGSYGTMSGTSFAAPYVAGAAALEIGRGQALIVNGAIVSVNSRTLPNTRPAPTTIPGLPTATPASSGGFSFIVSDQFFLLADSVLDFDVQSFLDSHNSPLKTYSETVVNDEVWSAAEIIRYEAWEYGLNPQVLLTYLEADKRLISTTAAQIPESFLHYTIEVAEKLSDAFYKYRDNPETAVIPSPGGQSQSAPQNLNPGTYAIIRALAEALTSDEFTLWASGASPRFHTLFETWFPDSNDVSHPPMVIAEAIPSGYSLPFGVNHTWRYIGGPHRYSGGVVGCTSGSGCPRPWSSIDIAPLPYTACPNPTGGSTTYTGDWIVAVQSGSIVESSTARLVIDHGNGWRTYYSHVSSSDKHGLGAVNQYDPIGHPSCEIEPSGVNYQVHTHIAIWNSSQGFVDIHGSTFSGWTVAETSHYNGTMTHCSDGSRVADYNSRLNDGINYNNEISNRGATICFPPGKPTITSPTQGQAFTTASVPLTIQPAPLNYTGHFNFDYQVANNPGFNPAITLPNNWQGDGVTSFTLNLTSGKWYVKARQGDGLAAGDWSDTVSFSVSLGTDLVVTQTDAPDPVGQGSNVTYTVTVANSGPQNASTVNLSDTLPSGVTFVSATPNQGTCDAPSGGVLSCALGTINSGANATVDVVVQTSASTPSSITNTASVTSATNDTNTSNNTNIAQSTSVLPTANLGITGQGSASVAPGGSRLLTFSYSNAGPQGAPVQITITTPANTTVSNITITHGSCSTTSGFVCTIPSLASGVAGTVKFNLNLGTNARGALQTTAAISGTGVIDPVAGNDSATTTTNVNAQANVGITVIDSVDPVLAGNQLVETLLVTNSGPASALNSFVTMNIPSGLTVGMLPAGCVSDGTDVGCGIDVINSGSSVSLPIPFNVGGAVRGTISTTASITTTETDNVPANNTATQQTTVNAQADLEMALATSAQNWMPDGSPLSFTATLYNIGPSTATNTTITFPVPSGTSFNSASGGCTNNSGTVTCAVGVLNSGSSTSRVITVIVNASLSTLANGTATVSATETDPVPQNNSRSASVSVIAGINNPAYQGQLVFGAQQSRSMNGGEQQYWGYGLTQTVTPYCWDIQRPSGSTIRFRVILRRNNGEILRDFRSAPDGRAIIAIEGNSGQEAGEYQIILISEPGTSGAYNIIGYNGCIPRLLFGQNQTSASNITHWRYTLDGNYTYSIRIFRNEGNFEYNYVLGKVGGGELASGSSVNGNMYIYTSSGAGDYNLYLTSPSGIGAYSIIIQQGIYEPMPPKVTLPAPNRQYPTDFNVTLQPGAGNSLGQQFRIQIANNPGFSSAQTTDFSSTTTIPVHLSPGSYYVRAQQRDTDGRESGWSDAVAFTVAGADLSVSVGDSPDPADRGAVVTYLIPISNVGPSSATGVTLSQTLPSNASFVDAAPSQGSCAAPSGGVLNCTLGTINASAGAMVTVRVQVNANASTALNTQVTVNGTSADANSANNTASQSTTVNADPGAPWISDTTNQSTDEDAPPVVFPFTIGDSNTPVTSLTVTGASSNQALVTDARVVILGGGANRSVRITPTANQSGDVEITLCVKDTTNLSACDSFILTVVPVNDAPTISNIVNLNTNRSTPVTIPFTIGDIDNAVATLTLTKASSNQTLVPDANISFGGSGANRTVTITPAPNQIGSAQITMCVNDGALEKCDSFLLNIVAPPDAIFSDGFESGNLSAWTTSITDNGDLSVTPAAALVGSAGMQAVINDANALYVADDTPVAEPRYRARFHLDPNSLAMANNDNFSFFFGFQGAGTAMLQAQLRYFNGAYQVRIGAIDNGVTWYYTPYATITDAPHMFELDWLAASADGANDGALNWWIDQVAQTPLTSLDTDERRVDRVRLGAVAGMDAGTNGTVFFDAFISRRLTYIGRVVAPPTLVAPADATLFAREVSPSLSWNTVATATQYYAELTNGTTVTVNSGWLAGTSWAPGAQPQGAYTWRVKARNAAGEESPWSAVRTLTVRPGVPTNLQGTAVSTTRVNLTWTASVDAPAGIVRYRILRGNTQIGISSNTTPSFTDTSAPDCSAVQYKVRSDNGTITSLDSNIITVNTPCDAIFSDGFEGGNLSAWNLSATDGSDLSVTAAASLTGNTRGLQAFINDLNALYVGDDTPNAEARYRARFYFDPNGVAMASNDNFSFFFGFQGAGTAMLQAQLRYFNGAYQVRIGAMDDNSVWYYTPYATISDASHIFEFDWQAATAGGANNGTLAWWIDQTAQTSLTALDTDTRRVDRVRLGAVAGMDSSTNGTVFFDAFISHRATYIGPEVGGLGDVIEPTMEPTEEINPEVTPEVTDEPTADVTPEATVEPTTEPTAEVTPEATVEPTAEPTIEPTAVPTEEPTTVPPPTETPTVVPTPTNTPTPEPTLLPFSLPVFQTMDDGAPLWSASTGWQLNAAAAYNGLGWQALASGQVETLALNVPVTLSAAVPTLSFQSKLVSGALPEVRVSLDGATWQTVAVVTPSLNWALTTVDLSAYAGQTIRVQFVWASPAGVSETWQVDEVTIADGAVLPPMEPSATPVTATPAAPGVEPTAAPQPDITIVAPRGDGEMPVGN